MIVHPNPMTKLKNGDWEDTHLQKVRVQPQTLNRKNHPQRWVVYTIHGKLKKLAYVSRHITEEQAVVSAQTLANRLYLKARGKSPRRSRRVMDTLNSVKVSEIDALVLEATTAGMWAIDLVTSNDAREKARLAIAAIKSAFKL